MKTSIIIKHSTETKWLVLKYTDESLTSEEWCDTESEATTAKANWDT